MKISKENRTKDSKRSGARDGIVNLLLNKAQQTIIYIRSLRKASVPTRKCNNCCKVKTSDRPRRQAWISVLSPKQRRWKEEGARNPEASVSKKYHMSNGRSAD